MPLQDPKDEIFYDHVVMLFKTYNDLVTTNDLNYWIQDMLSRIHTDWRDGKLSDTEFAHLTSHILCWQL